MSKFQHYQNIFLTGEISPRAIGRADLQQYDSAVSLMENFTAHPSGGAFKRQGTRYSANISDMPNAAILEFIIDDDEGFVVLIDLSSALSPFRVFNEQGVLQPSQQALDTEIALISTFPQTVNPEDFIYSQQGDIMVIVHASGTIPPLIVTRVAGVFTAATYSASLASFSLGEGEFPFTGFRFPYRAPNITSTTITASDAGGGSFTLTASSDIFNVGHIGSIFKITVGAQTSLFRIQIFNSSTLVTGIAILLSPGTTDVASTNWQEQAWSDFRGWPRTVVGFQQRLNFGGNRSQPVTIWSSLLGNIFFMNSRKLAQDQDAVIDQSGLGYFGVNLESDPFDFNVATRLGSGITFLANDRSLIAGTSTEEYVIGREGQFFGFSESGSVDVSKQTNYGSRAGKVANVRDETLFISRDGRKLRNFRFSENNGSNISINLSLMADRIHRHGGNSTGFKEVTYNQTRDVVWMLTNNGSLVGFTYQQDAGAIAWHRHSISGSDEITGISNVPSISGNFDTTFLVVKRTIDGQNVTYLEKIPEDFDGELDTSPPVESDEDIPAFLDSSVLLTMAMTSDTISGLDHLEGEQIAVLVNGSFQGLFIVAGGEVTLSADIQAGSFVVAGLKFTATIENLPIEAGGDFGAAQTQIRRIDRVIARLYKTFDFKIGQVGGSKLDELKFTELFTGIKDIRPPAGHGRDLALRIVSDMPYPCNILALGQRGVAYD